MATYKDIKLNAIDENIEDLEYINQTGKLILAVPLGSIPFVEDFGSGVIETLDAPLNARTIAILQAGSFEALDGFIPDTEVTSVLVTQESGNTIQVKPSILYKGKVLE